MISFLKINKKLGPFWSGFLFSIIVFGILTSTILFLPGRKTGIDLKGDLIIYGILFLASVASGFMNRYILGSKKNAVPYFSYKERSTLMKYYRKKIIPSDLYEKQRLLLLLSRNVVIMKRSARFFLVFFFLMSCFEIFLLITDKYFIHEKNRLVQFYPIYFILLYVLQRLTVKRYEEFKSRLESATVNNKKYPWSDSDKQIDYKTNS